MGHGTVPKCGGTNRQGQPCGNPAGKNTDHFGTGNCSNHGGSTPSGRVHALNQQAERLLYKYDAGPVADPLEALQRLAGRALALEEAFGKLVNDMESLRYEDEHSAEQLRSEVALLERAMDRCGRLLVDIAKLNIDERLARVTEKQAEMTERALLATLGEMGLSSSQQSDACQRLHRHLRAVP